MKTRVTQKDVARKAGVSNMAVSLALRGHHSIPKRTQDRIKKIAQKLGYFPDPMLSSLAAYRMRKHQPMYQSNIAWINTWDDPQKMQTSIFWQYFLSAEKRAKELGYQLEEFRLVDFDGNEKRMEKAILARGITGILLQPCEDYGLELHMDFSRFSAIRFGYSWRYPILLTVANAMFRTASNLVKKLVTLGYERIGMFIPPNMTERTDWNFIGGFAAAQQFIPSKNRIRPLLSPKRNVKKLEKWVKQTRPEVVIGLSGLEGILKTGIKVDYADLSVHTNELQRTTGMYQNDALIGKTAIDLLSGMMHRGETGIPEEYHHHLIESIWNPGTTALGRASRARK